jgi:hypothetical protein
MSVREVAGVELPVSTRSPGSVHAGRATRPAAPLRFAAPICPIHIHVLRRASVVMQPRGEFPDLPRRGPFLLFVSDEAVAFSPPSLYVSLSSPSLV